MRCSTDSKEFSCLVVCVFNINATCRICRMELCCKMYIAEIQHDCFRAKLKTFTIILISICILECLVISGIKFAEITIIRSKWYFVCFSVDFFKQRICVWKKSYISNMFAFTIVSNYIKNSRNNFSNCSDCVFPCSHLAAINPHVVTHDQIVTHFGIFVRIVFGASTIICLWCIYCCSLRRLRIIFSHIEQILLDFFRDAIPRTSLFNCVFVA